LKIFFEVGILPTVDWTFIHSLVHMVKKCDMVVP